MKKTFTQSMAWLHTWGSLLLGWLLAPIFFTGTLAVFEPELSHWMRPELHQANTAPLSASSASALAQARLHAIAPHASSWQIFLPDTRHPALEIGWEASRVRQREYLDPRTGAALRVRATEGGHFFTHFHAELNAGKVGRALVCVAGLVMLASIISGIVVHKKIFQDFFTFRPRASSQRAWLDAHNVLGVLSLPFLLMISYSGVIMLVDDYLPAATTHLYQGKPGARAEVVKSFDRKPLGQPANLPALADLTTQAEQRFGVGMLSQISVRAPGDAAATVRFSRHIHDRLGAVADHVSYDAASGALRGVQTDWNPMAYLFRALVGLHIVKFGGYPALALYFLAGLAATALIAGGLVLYTIKRRKRGGQAFGAATTRIHALIEALNVAAIAGIVLASAAYLWSNRLLPASWEARASAEVGGFFAVWALSLLHALLRPPLRAWFEQVSLAAALCGLLPLLDVATGQQSDPMAQGVDAVAVLLALALTWLAWRLRPPHAGHAPVFLNKAAA